MIERAPTNGRPTRRYAHWGIILSDLVLVNAAFALAYILRYKVQLFRGVDPVNYVPYGDYLAVQVGYTLVSLLTLRLDGAWTLRRGASWLDEVYSIINGTTTGMAIVLVVIFGIRPLAFSRLLLLYVSVLTVLFLSVARLVRRQILQRRRRHGIGVDRTLIVGAGEVGLAVMRTMVARPDLGYHVVGFVESDSRPCATSIGRFQRLGCLADLPALVREHRVTEVIITLPTSEYGNIEETIRQCSRVGAHARIVPDFFQLSLNQVDVDNLAGIPLIGVQETTLDRGPRLLKRVMDVCGSLVGLVISSPFMLATAIAIRLDSPGPILYKQERLGERGHPFEVIKFRSMRQGADAEKAALMALNEADGPLFKIKDDPRSTRVGRFLRRSSLDEFPQFFNVLRGEMSLVGPRPPLASEVEEYESWQLKRLAVKPGITGLWQVSGRSDLTFDEMCLLDIYYIENWSLGLDIRIILRTIPQSILGKGAY